MATLHSSRLLLLVALTSVGLAAIACSEGGACPTCPSGVPSPAPAPSPVAPPAAPSLQSIAVVGPATLQAGRDATFTVRATMSDGTSTTPAAGVIWSTSDPRVLGVSATGVGSAIASGNATLTASYQSRSATTLVTIAAAPAPAPAPPAAPSVTVAGLWRMTTTPSLNTRGCDVSSHSYEVRLTQNGSSVSASSLTTAQPGPRPIFIGTVTAFRFIGTVRDASSVTFDVSISETGTDANGYQTTGLFTGSMSGSTITGSFNGTIQGTNRANCQSSSHSLMFVRQ